jgi:hypothetical protein
MQTLDKRNSARRAELHTQLDAIRAELQRLDALKTLRRGTQYAIDFANPGESTISREELEETITEDIGIREAEEGEASRMIEEAIAAGELKDGGINDLGGGESYRRILIPFQTWRKAGYRV